MHDNELFVLSLGTVVLIFIGFYRAQFGRLPAASWLFAAFISIWIAWVATVLEHVAFPVFFNLVEHLGYMANAVLLLSWCWMAMRSTTVDVND
jgi:hypothetical protein